MSTPLNLGDSQSPVEMMLCDFLRLGHQRSGIWLLEMLTPEALHGHVRKRLPLGHKLVFWSTVL